MPKREFNLGSGENPEQKEQGKILLQKIEQILKETPQTKETIAALSVLNSLVGAMYGNEEDKLALEINKFNEEALKRIKQRENEKN
jgi:hypothetical protein